MGLQNLHSDTKPNNKVVEHLCELTLRRKYEVDNNLNTTKVNFHITATAYFLMKFLTRKIRNYKELVQNRERIILLLENKRFSLMRPL